MQEEAIKEIKNIKLKIKEIYYIQEFEQAEEFEKRLQEIQNKYFLYEISFENYSLFIKEIVDLEWNIDTYMEEYGENKKKQITVKNFSNQIKEFISSSNRKSPEELIVELKAIHQVIEEYNLDEILNYQLNQLLARALLCIFVKQIKNDEPIDLRLIEDLTTPEVFTNEIQEQLIKMAKQKDENTASEILDLCKQVNPNTLQEEKVWKILSDSNQVKFKENENETIQAIEEKQVETLQVPMLAVEPKKLSLVDRLFGSNNGTAKYIFGEWNERTKRYENIKEEYHCFPPKKRLLKKCRSKCIELEINDVDVVDMNFIHEMPFLQSLTFGRNVHTITKKKTDRTVLIQSLKKVNFGEDVTNIDLFSFENCIALKTVELPNSLEYLGEGAFYGCTNLESVKFGEKLTEIGALAFADCNSLEYIELPNSLIKLGQSAFWKCKNLEVVQMGNSIEEIGDSCFKDCEKLISTKAYRLPSAFPVIELPNSLKRLGKTAFQGCRSIEDVKIGNNLERLEEETFKNCTSLDYINLEQIKEIEKDCFEGCGFSSNILEDFFAPKKNESDNRTNSKYESNKQLLEDEIAELFEGTPYEFLEDKPNDFFDIELDI